MFNSRFCVAAVLLGSMVSTSAIAQDESDALRYSFLSPMGTARSMGFGSALGSVGGDFTSLSVNPAGIGIYRRSEFMFTPALRINSVDGTYLGDFADASNTRLTVGNIGVVLTKAEKGRRYERSGWKTVSFGFGLNRLADYNRNYTYNGLMKGTGDDHSSFSEIFLNDAIADPGGTNVNGTLGFLGYQSYLIDAGSNGYFTYADWTRGLNQKRSVKERGGLNELIFSLGGNYEEKLMLGATLGLPIVKFSQDAYFEETDATGSATDSFASFRYNTSLKTSGLGVNLKLGAIFKPNDYFRLGVAVHTPSWLALTDVFNESLTANTQNAYGINSASSIENQYSYYITTPWRAIVSGTVMMGQYGFITADYEYVDYASPRISFENGDNDAESLRNQRIRNAFQSASNFRLGIEARLDNFFLRGGFGYYGSPYKTSSSNANRLDLSGGVGFRSGSFFTDLAFVHSAYSQYEQPYVLPDPVVTPTAKLENKLNTLAWTIGWKL